MSTDITAEMIIAEPLFTLPQALVEGPEEEDEGEEELDEDDDEEERDADVYDAIRGPAVRDAWHEQEVEEGGVPAPLWDDSWPTSLLDLSSVNGGES